MFSDQRDFSYGHQRVFSLIENYAIRKRMLVAEETINNLIKSKINISVLEVGCGFYARNIQYLKQRFPDVAFVGVDLKCSSIDGIELIEDDIEIWEPSSKFDCVLSLAVVEHLVNLQRHFDLLSFSLSESGVAVMTTPTPQAHLITSAIKYSYIDDFVIYSMHGKD